MKHAHVWKWDRKGGRNLWYNHNQQNQLREHQYNETGEKL
jgi:hypothetical protein